MVRLLREIAPKIGEGSMSAHAKLLAVLFLCFLASGGCCCLDHGPCGPCGPLAGGCGSCGGCGVAPYRVGGRLPGAVYHWANRRLSCGAGCGPVYWHEWMMDPPACCDPCDDCGNWVGHGCGACYGSGPRRPVQSILTFLFARRYCRSCASCGVAPGCGVEAGCAAGCDGGCGADPMLQPADVAWDGGGDVVPAPAPHCSHCGH